MARVHDAAAHAAIPGRGHRRDPPQALVSKETDKLAEVLSGEDDLTYLFRTTDVRVVQAAYTPEELAEGLVRLMTRLHGGEEIG
jgi:hypothetical protein